MRFRFGRWSLTSSSAVALVDGGSLVSAAGSFPLLVALLVPLTPDDVCLPTDELRLPIFTSTRDHCDAEYNVIYPTDNLCYWSA